MPTVRPGFRPVSLQVQCARRKRPEAFLPTLSERRTEPSFPRAATKWILRLAQSGRQLPSIVFQRLVDPLRRRPVDLPIHAFPTDVGSIPFAFGPASIPLRKASRYFAAA